jgi:hypothetical protein
MMSPSSGFCGGGGVKDAGAPRVIAAAEVGSMMLEPPRAVGDMRRLMGG